MCAERGMRSLCACVRCAEWPHNLTELLTNRYSFIQLLPLNTLTITTTTATTTHTQQPTRPTANCQLNGANSLSDHFALPSSVDPQAPYCAVSSHVVEDGTSFG